MNKIISLEQAVVISKKLRAEGKKIVLAGGCFDIFHYGHFKFLQKANKLGDVLIIALESDQKVNKLKGPNRPITTQLARAEILSALKMIDFIILLPYLPNDKSYNNITMSLKPNIIAVTENDPQITNKQKQADLINAQIKVIPHVNTCTTTKLLEIINKEK